MRGSLLLLNAGSFVSAAARAAGDGCGQVESFQPSIECAAAEAEHLGGGLLVPAGADQRALDVIALDGGEQIRMAIGGGWRFNPAVVTGDRGRHAAHDIPVRS